MDLALALRKLVAVYLVDRGSSIQFPAKHAEAFHGY